MKKNHQVQVRATNDEGAGDWSPPGRIRTTPPRTPPPAVGPPSPPRDSDGDGRGPGGRALVAPFARYFQGRKATASFKRRKSSRREYGKTRID